MLSKYKIEFSTPVGGHQHPAHYSTDDPVTCQELLTELLDRGCAIHAIKHEGVNLKEREFDHLVKAAANMMTAKKLCHSLGIKQDEERHRFGFSG